MNKIACVVAVLLGLMASPARSETFSSGFWTVEKSHDAFEGRIVCRFSYRDPSNPTINVDWANDFMQVSGFQPLVSAEVRVDGGPIQSISAFNYFGRQRSYVESLNRLGVVLLSSRYVAGAAKVTLRVRAQVAEISLVDFVAARDRAVASGCASVDAAR